MAAVGVECSAENGHVEGGVRPSNVGIVGIEFYVPPQYVEQSELEQHDGVSEGKYVIGLGQDRMAFCTDREDVNSICLTVVQSLMEKHNIDPSQVGRLEVGTETLLDKSKSVKSVLMQLFQPSGNTNIEGVDTINACYGGTNALFNSIAWVESSAWDGRYAIVVCGDNALYAPGPARPTGGAGAVAMLIGANAPIVVERDMCVSHMEHTYDFYKPDPAVPYPTVDGPATVSCFMRAIDRCYERFAEKYEKKTGRKWSLDEAAYLALHSPYNKLVQKSVGRYVFHDARRNRDAAEYEALKPYLDLPMEQTYGNRDLEKASTVASKPVYKAKVAPATLIPKQVGNLYCASLYSSLLSVLCSVDDLVGKRILLFSYGSGLASSMFTVRVVSDYGGVLAGTNVRARLDARRKVSPDVYTKVLAGRQEKYGKPDYTPTAEITDLAPGTFYLAGVDKMYRRKYERHASL